MIEIFQHIGWVQIIALASVIITPMGILFGLAKTWLNNRYKLQKKRIEQSHELDKEVFNEHE